MSWRKCYEYGCEAALEDDMHGRISVAVEWIQGSDFGGDVVIAKRIPLGQLCNIVTKGTTPTSLGYHFSQSGIPFLRIQNISNETVSLDDILYIDQDTHEALGRSKIKGGDFLITIAGTIGRTAIVPQDFPESNCNQAVAILRFDQEKLYPKYLLYWLSTPDAQGQIRGRSVTATISNLSLGQIKELEIPLPPLTEQKRIAAILDKADTIRRKRQQAIQLADEFLRSVFLDLFGDPVTNPKGWEVKSLKELSLKITSGSTPKGGSKVYVDKGITFFRSQNVWKNDIRLDDVAFIDNKTHESLKKSSLKHKDILMTKTGRFNTENSSLGRAALFLGRDDSANVNGHVYLIRLKKAILHEFVVYILTSNEYRDHIRNVCVGGIDKRQLNKEHIEDFPIICPPGDLQLEFIENLRKIHKVRSDFTKGMKDVVPLFNALSQKAFSGKL